MMGLIGRTPSGKGLAVNGTLAAWVFMLPEWTAAIDESAAV
jgi:hypothetical protein